jgi:hypothetical protein
MVARADLATRPNRSEMIAEEGRRLHPVPVAPHARTFGLTRVVAARHPLRGTGARVA